MPLTMRPTGLGSGSCKDTVDYSVWPQNAKDDTFLIRIANEDNESGWITLHFQSLEDAREARAALETVIKVGARNM